MARHVDEGDVPDTVERGPDVAQLDREPSSVLLLEPVGILPGERTHQRGLAVVDVTRRWRRRARQPASAQGAAARRPPGRRRARPGRSAGRAAGGHRDAPDHGRGAQAQPVGQALRAARRRRWPARRRAHRHRRTAPEDRTATAAAADRRGQRRRAAAQELLGSRPQRRPNRRYRPGQRRLERGQGQLVDAQARGRRGGGAGARRARRARAAARTAGRRAACRPRR